MTGDVALRPLERSDADACDAVIRSLPYHFGDPDGLRQCAEAVRTQQGWVAYDSDEVVGFITLEPQFPESVEITWLAVRADRRRAGIGRALVERALESVGPAVAVMCVLTLGPSVPEPGVADGYEGTREFYRRLGFSAVKEIDIASWNNAFALLLVRPVRS